MELFLELHKELPREGPGCNSSTRHAFSLLPPLSSGAHLLEIGCGPGIQTLELASLMGEGGGTVTATDLNQEYLNSLERALLKSKTENVSCEIADMFNLKYDLNSFDLIWAEGAIFIIGFENGLTQWKPLLKPNGLIVVSELSWFTDNPPAEAALFWEVAYPGMKTVSENVLCAKKCGYDSVGHFALPESAWYDDFYVPMEKRIRKLQEKYATDQKAIVELENFMAEIDIYKKHSKHYGYEFYVLQAISA